MWRVDALCIVILSLFYLNSATADDDISNSSIKVKSNFSEILKNLTKGVAVPTDPSIILGVNTTAEPESIIDAIKNAAYGNKNGTSVVERITNVLESSSNKSDIEEVKRTLLNDLKNKDGNQSSTPEPSESVGNNETTSLSPGPDVTTSLSLSIDSTLEESTTPLSYQEGPIDFTTASLIEITDADEDDNKRVAEFKRRHFEMYKSPTNYNLDYDAWNNGPENETKADAKCTLTAPPLNLNLTKITGVWYPAKMSDTMRNLLVQSFIKEHEESSVNNNTCFLTEYEINGNESLDIILRHGNESTKIEAILLGDERHPIGSLWAISWPNGEDTLTSIVAAGVAGDDNCRYSWLITSDCDLNGEVEPDWAVMARYPEGIPDTILSTIITFAEGLKGFELADAITFQPNDCH